MIKTEGDGNGTQTNSVSKIKPSFTRIRNGIIKVAEGSFPLNIKRAACNAMVRVK